MRAPPPRGPGRGSGDRGDRVVTAPGGARVDSIAPSTPPVRRQGDRQGKNSGIEHLDKIIEIKYHHSVLPVGHI